jgi:aldose 1-epimerase
MCLGEDDSAPLRYACTQEITVTRDRVELCFAIRNPNSYEIPVGVGIHPYFAHRALATLSANLPRQWEMDDELLPAKLVDNPRAFALLRGLHVAEMPVVAEYAGWDGIATIEWPRLGLRVRLETEPRLTHAVLWVPEGNTFFCFEPTSHATDAQNGREGHLPGEDFIKLQPNAVHTQRFAFIVEAEPAFGGA